MTGSTSSASTEVKSLQYEARRFGRVDEQGRVFVKEGDNEREVGSYPDGLPEDPLALYVRRYLDLESSISLFESRLSQITAREMDASLKSFREQLQEPAIVGDIEGLRARVAKLEQDVDKRKVELREEREAAKEKALADRTHVVERAEQLMAGDPEELQWKKTGQELRDLLDQWKSLQRQGPRLEKAVEDALWKRFAAVRSAYDKGRRQFFAAQNEAHQKVKAIKERLIAEAEELRESTDWRETAAAYKQLMDQWRKAGRAGRKDDDALWARFRAAQQAFFDRLHEHDQEIDAERQENLTAKLELVKQAEALLPITDLQEAKAKFREIIDQFSEIGPVPGRERQSVDGSIGKVEAAIKRAEEEEWQRSNPETQARAQGMLSQLEDQIAKLQADLEAAQSAGDDKKAQQVSETLETKRAWLNQIQQTMN